MAETKEQKKARLVKELADMDTGAPAPVAKKKSVSKAKPAASAVDVVKLAKDVADIGGALSRLMDMVEKNAHAPAPVVSSVEPKDIAAVSIAASEKARSNRVTNNPEWEEIAREILGPALDHTEVEHERSGGIKFTVVIKLDYSNADKNYLELNKVDRRSKEISQEGLAGVEDWCRQIKANLTRTQKIGARQ